MTGTLYGLHPKHGDIRQPHNCTVFVFSTAGGESLASSIDFYSADPSVPPLKLTGLFGSYRIYTRESNCIMNGNLPILHEVPGNPHGYTLVSVLMEGKGTLVTSANLSELRAKFEAIPFPEQGPTLAADQYQKLLNVKKQVEGSLLGGHFSLAERSLGGTNVTQYDDSNCSVYYVHIHSSSVVSLAHTNLICSISMLRHQRHHTLWALALRMTALLTSYTDYTTCSEPPGETVDGTVRTFPD